MHNFNTFRLCLCLPLILVAKLFATAPQAIFYGSNLENTLINPKDTHQYHLDGKIGDVIWLRVRDAESPVDASFRFLDSQGQILKKVAGSGGLVEIFGYVLPADDTYTLEIFDNQANDAGRYAVALHKLNAPGYAYGLTCGEDLTHTLSVRCAAMAYRFHADGGESLILHARSANVAMEADMIMLDVSGQVITKAQIFNKNYAGWSPVLMPATGTYTVFFFDRGGNDLGDYGLSIQSLHQQNCNAEQLVCQSSQNNKINQLAEQHTFLLEHVQGRGEILMAAAKNTSFELSLQLFDSQGKPVAKQISSGKLNELWVDPQLPGGPYLVVVSDDRANDLSEYNLFFHTVDQKCVEPINTCQEMTGTLTKPCEVVHYQFAGQTGALITVTVKEIDRLIEPVVLLFDEKYNLLARVSHSDKAVISNLKLAADGLLHLLIFDQGGNDLGRFKLEWLQSGDNSLTGPVALCKPIISKTLIGSDPVKITVAEVDDGSYDPCGAFKLELSKTVFSCADIGEQSVVLTIRNERGATNTCKTKVNIASDMVAKFPSCIEVFPAYTPAACAKLSPIVSGGSPDYRYLWNDQSFGSTLAVCPASTTPYLVTVTDSKGCSTAAQVMVEAVDITCANNKVFLCHLPDGNPANAQTLCINPGAVAQHLNDHQGCTLGVCGTSNCLSAGNIWYGGRSQKSSSISSSALVLPRGQQVTLPLQALAPEITSGSWSVYVVNTWGQPLAELRLDVQNPVLSLTQPGIGGNMVFVRCIHQSMTGEGSDTRLVVIPIVFK